MGKKYTNTNKIKFTNISDKYEVQRGFKAVISSLHADIITYVTENFRDSRKYKEQVVRALNTVTYKVYSGEGVDSSWKLSSPLVNIPEVPEDYMEETLGDILLTAEGIDWNIKPTNTCIDLPEENKGAVKSNSTKAKQSAASKVTKSSTDDKKKVAYSTPVTNESNASTNKGITASVVISPTPKQDLYIQPPVVPQFDYKRPWLRGTEGADSLVIYTTLPEIPTRQNEISVSTDISKMRTSELMNLYPNCIIHTRASVMYEPVEGIELDSELGLILPIEGFTREQVIDNIIRYPHIFKLVRVVDNTHYSFYSRIEIEGELHGTLDIWDELPEASVIPCQAEFVKEYVVRRYLLERDVKGIKHRYPIYGTFEPFLTLFMPSDRYIHRGYVDTEQIARQCVTSRVSYKQSRNPIIRRLTNNA